MTRRVKQAGYLIAVEQRREAVRVYAVIAASREAAVAQIEPLATAGVQVACVGGLSRDMVRHIGLKPGEVRLV